MALPIDYLKTVHKSRKLLSENMVESGVKERYDG